MPRKARYGLDYHNVDVFFYEELDTQMAIIYGGAETMVIYKVLLGKIYQAGHFYKFDALNKLVFLFKKDFHFDDERIIKAFEVLIEYGFFDKEAFDEGYITSVEIQKFYYSITKNRRYPYQDECWMLSEEEMKYIETPKKMREANKKIDRDVASTEKGTAEVYQSTPEQEESSLEIIKSTQSKSNTQTHTQSKTKKKGKEMLKEKGDSPQVVIPSHYDGYLETMIKQGLIKVHDINNEKINDLLIESRKNYRSSKLYDAVRYTINQLHKNKWQDGKGKMVVDKFQYFKKSLMFNLERIESNEDFQNDPRPVEEKVLGNIIDKINANKQ